MGLRQCVTVMVLVALCGCKNAIPGADAVARVNGEAITRQAFEELVERNLRRYSDQTKALPTGIRTRIEEGVLRRMVDDVMVEQRARKEGVSVSEGDLTTHLAQHKQRFRNTQAFTDYLARSDTSEVALKEDLRKSLLRDRLVDKLTGSVTVDDAAVAQYYQQNAKLFAEPQHMLVRRLILRTPQDATRHRLASIAQAARKLHDKAKARPGDFADLCKHHSEGPEAEHGGSMGVVTSGRMPELDKLMADGLPAMAISPITQTAQGLEIYQVADIVPEHQRALADEAQAIREALLMRMRNDRRQEVLRGLKDGATVDILISFVPAPTTPAPALSPAPAAGALSPAP